MIDYGGDGFRQHFKALVYYSRYLKELIGSILRGSFILPQWDFVIGEGSDILKAFHYYCIGDIFTFFSFLCPEKWMYLYYDGATLARMYFSGLAFAWICFYKNRKNIYGVLAGSLLYAFCAFSFSSMSGHVFFISAAVFLPLIILGTEKVICYDKPFLLILSVMLSSMSNIYFFYMNVLSTVLYVLIRLLFMDGAPMEKAKALFKIGLYSILGVIMSCVIFLPMVRTMLFSNRLDSDVSISLLFSLKEYKTMFKNMTFGGIYFGSFSFLWLTSFSYLFNVGKNKTLIALLITGLLFVGLPYLSAAYNAFTYPIDRWCYAMSLLVSYIITDSLEDISDLNECFYLNIALSVLYYFSCIFMDRSSWQLHVLFFAETLFFLFFVKYVKKKTLCELCAAGLVIISLLFQSFYEFGPAYWGYYKFGTDIEIVNNMDNDEHSVFRELEDDSLFRYSGNRMTLNQTVLGEHSSTQYYWSIANDYVVDFRKQLAYSDSSNHHYNNYSERFAQNALSGVKYYVNRKEDGPVPYGFEFMDKYYPCNVAKFVANYFDTTGKLLYCDLIDHEMGALTINLGIAKCSDKNIRLGYNLRVPLNDHKDGILKAFEEKTKEFGLSLNDISYSESHYVSPHSLLVRSLQKAYVDQTGDHESKPMVIGGGTYAKAIPNAVAAGPNFPYRKDICHEPDEHIYLEDLDKWIEIYAKAIYLLTK